METSKQLAFRWNLTGTIAFFILLVLLIFFDIKFISNNFILSIVILVLAFFGLIYRWIVYFRQEKLDSKNLKKGYSDSLVSATNVYSGVSWSLKLTLYALVGAGAIIIGVVLFFVEDNYPWQFPFVGIGFGIVILLLTIYMWRTSAGALIKARLRGRNY